MVQSPECFQNASPGIFALLAEAGLLELIWNTNVPDRIYRIHKIDRMRDELSTVLLFVNPEISCSPCPVLF
jgi:hypothetical protein